MAKFFLIPVAVTALLLSSCKTSQMASFDDDVYSNPKEDQMKARLAAEEKARKEAEEQKQQEEAAAAQKAKDDANPYYQDPSYSKDDYYDYQYAARINRFSTPIQGAGYYDNYYTNTYTYNQNPASYGNSIYSSYNYGMPSQQFSSLNMGFGSAFGSPYSSFGMGYGMGMGSGMGYSPYSSFGYGMGMGSSYGMMGYSPYGYGSMGYSPYYGSSMMMGMGYGYGGYSPYGYNGFYDPYMMSYYGGYSPYGYGSPAWGYLNSYDVNSGYSTATYGVRGSNGGGNSPERSSGGRVFGSDGSSQRLIESVNEQQNTTPRFSNISGSSRMSNTNAGPTNSGRSAQQISNHGANNFGYSQGGRVSNSNSVSNNNTNTFSNPESNPRNNANSTRITHPSENSFNGNSGSGRSSWGGGNSGGSWGGGGGFGGGSGGGFGGPRGGGGGGGGRR